METFNHSKAVERLKTNVTQEFNSFFPYEREGYRFEVKNITIEEPSVARSSQQEAFLNDDSIEAIVRGDVEVYYQGKQVKKHNNTVLTRVPYPTERGTFISDGNEVSFLNRMQMREGIYIHPSRNVNKTAMITAEVRVGKQRFQINFDTDKATLHLDDLEMEFGKKGGTVNVVALLRFLGVSDNEIKQAINDTQLAETILQKTKQVTPQKIYNSFFNKKYPGSAEKAREEIQAFLSGKLVFNEDSQKINSYTIGNAVEKFDATAMLSTISQLTKEYKTPGASVNPDDFRFKEIKAPEDTVGEFVRKGIRDWVTKRLQKITYTEMNENKQKNLNAKPDQLVYKQTKSLYTSDLSENVDSANPLDVHQKLYKVTSLGTGGLNARSANPSTRNIQDTAFSKIDPLETPQSDRMGLVQSFASGAEIKNGRLYSKFYRVKNGNVDSGKVIDDIDPLDEFEEYIAFNNPAKMNKNDQGKVLSFKDNDVRVRHRGEFVTVPKEKVTLIDYDPSAHLSHAMNLIPFGAHNDGARMLMGAGMAKQSLSLEQPDAPLVQSLSDSNTGKTMEEELADRASYMLKSPVSGTIKTIGDDFIEIDTGKGVEKVDKLNYFTTGKAGGYIHHKPVVKEGDRVKAGSLLADGWQSKDGKLALGKNIQVAYMPYKGYNFEDGVVVSEAFAKKMASEEIKVLEFTLENTEGMTFGSPDAKKVLKSLNVSPGILNKLDQNGVIKKGADISNGDIFVAAVKKKEQKDLSAGEKDIRRMINRQKILDLPSDNFVDVSKKAVGYQKGKVVEVKTIPSGDNLKVSIKLLSFKPMEIGDKLAGRHGNKGTITKIVPDKEMPQTTDGKAMELIFSPLAVPSRKNIGQLLEMNAGLVAEKKGLDAYKVQNFDSSERERLEKELEEIGIPDGKQVLINPETGKPYENSVTAGPMYIMKLKHKVENKITHRNINGEYDELTTRPRKTSGNTDGDRHNPQSVGGMEFWSLTSQGAVENIHEMTTLKSDGAGDLQRKKEIFEAIRRGMPIPEPVTPGTVKVLKEKLNAAGVEMTALRDDKEVTLDDKFTELMLNPLKEDKLKALAPVPITTAKGLKSRTNTFFPGGIYDENIFGKDGDRWSRIDLAEPVPNPLFLDTNKGPLPYEAMLFSKNLKQKDIQSIVQGDKFYVFDAKDSGFNNGDLVTLKDLDELYKKGKDINVDTGGSALSTLLQTVDLKSELKSAEERLRSAKNLDERSKAEKHVRVISRALDKGLEPKDFMMNSLPVLPLKHRKPLQMAGGKTFAEDGISTLYQSLLYKNEKMQELKQFQEVDEVDPAALSKAKKQYYENVKNIIGVGDPYIDRKKNQEVNGIMHTLKSKPGFIRSKMQSKLQDYSGRSVITVDPTLKLDEVALPEDMAADMFKAHVLKELQNNRYSRKEVESIIENRTEPFKRALTKVTENHPVILNRQPSLHGHSVQAFYPKINWNGDKERQRAIGLNPVVTTAFNADFDGDQMAVHLPLTTKAIKEAEDKLLPSKNLLNPTNNGLITDLKHEMQLGIYYMTRDRMPTGTPKEYKNFKELSEAYQKGEVGTYDSVRMTVPGVGTKIATTGAHLFNLSLPRGFQNYEDNIDVNKKRMEEIIMEIINDPQKGGIQRAVETINKLQTVGFETATTSGMSIGVKDFDPIRGEKRNEIFLAAETELKDKYKDRLASGMIDARDAYEVDKVNIVKEQLEKHIKENLDPENPIQIMQRSGARGKASQLNAMAGIIGIGKDVEGKSTRPITVSHLDGLSPDQFWDLSYDSRKGILDKSIETAKPGELSRDIWMANKHTVISEKDCGDTIGITLNMEKHTDKLSLHGRVLLKDVSLKGGGVIRKTGRPITIKEREQISTKAEGPVNVRSPLSCRTTDGVCQKCYGAKPGGTTNDFVDIGTPVGSIAAQALGEPSTQAIMRTFHVGGAQSTVSGAFDRIQETLRLPQEMGNPAISAVIAEADGKVESIAPHPITGTVVKIGKKKYNLRQKELDDKIKVGAFVKKGDLITKEFNKNNERLVIRNPHDVLKYQGAEEAKNYLTSSIQDAYMSGEINDTDRRHYEVVTTNLMNSAKITDPGTSPFSAGQIVPLNQINKYNQQAGRIVTVPLDYNNRLNVIGSVAAQDYSDVRSPMKTIVKKGDVITEEIWEQLKSGNRRHIKVKKKDLQFEQQLKGVRTVDLSSENWLNAAAYKDATRVVGEAATLGMKEKLDNPLTRQMTGLKGNFSSGFQSFKDNIKERFVNGFF